MEIFQYAFMRRAFIVGIILAVIIPCVGVVVVLKRLSMMGDALSHSSLAGVTLGLIMGINPVLGAMISCIIAAFGIELIRKKMPQHAELAIAIIMSTGIGLAGVLSGFVKNTANFNSFLFGSIVAISDFELFLVIGIGMIVLVSFILLYRELFFMSFNEHGAKLAGVPVNMINRIFTLLIAVTVAIAARTVGSLIVSAMMVVPVACSLQWAKSYKQTVIFSALFGILFMISGLCLAYYVGLKPGGTIVLIGVICFILSLMIKKIRK